MPALTTAQLVSTAHDLWAQEVNALCAGRQNAGIAPELSAAYDFLTRNRENVWHLYDDKGRYSPRLQYLYSRRHVYGVLMAAVGLDVTYGEAGVTESLSDEAKNFLACYKAADDEITALEKQVRAGAGIAVGQMVTTQPRQPCAPWQPNPASGYYRGDPLSRGPWDRQ